MTTKILALNHVLGNLADFYLPPGQAHDLLGVPKLIEGLHADHMLADCAFDANGLRDALGMQDTEPVIPPRKNGKQPAQFDKEIYK